MSIDLCFRVRQIPVATDIHSLAQAILERFLDEGDITIDKERSTLVECCYNPKTAKTAIIHFRPKPPHPLRKLRSNETYEFEISPGCDVFIDKNFYGLTQLYTPLANIKLDIIAISGLNGHAYGSWAGNANSEGRKKMWLRHFFQSDRPDCRTMIYGYNSSLSEPGMHTLSDYSVGFLEEIYKARKGCEERPVALVGHSFGGIIIAKALVEDRESPQRKGNLFKMTKAIVFFATPHRGMLFDDIREMVGDGSPRLDLVDAIGRGQEAVDLLSFTRYTEEEHFRVVSFHELFQTRRLKMDPETGVWARTGPYYTAVEKDCSILNLPSNIEEVLGGEGDHSSLVKFRHPQDHTYTTVLTRFSNLIDHLDQARFKDQATVNSLLRLAVSRNEHSLVSILLTIGQANPNAEDLEGMTKALPRMSTKDIRMLKLLTFYGARMDIPGIYHGHDRLRGFRSRPEEEIDLNHSKRCQAEHVMNLNISDLNLGGDMMNEPTHTRSTTNLSEALPPSTSDNAAIGTPHTRGPAAGPIVSRPQPFEPQTELQLYEYKAQKEPSILWGKAFSIFRAQEGKNSSSRDEMFLGDSLVDCLINEVEEKNKNCDNKRWFYNKGDKKVFIIDTLLVQLKEYAPIGSLAIQKHPDIVALAWAGLRGLLKVGTAYADQMRAVSDSLEYLVKVLCCCEIYEKLYCNTVLSISKDLDDSFVDLYVSILKYLRKTSRYLDHSTGGRIDRSFSQERGHMLSEIESKETTLNKRILVAEREDQDNNMTQLRLLLRKIRSPIDETKRVAELIYTKVTYKRRLAILGWLSSVEYESHHLLSVQRRLSGTGSWLLENEPFIRWGESEVNSILWLRADAGFGKTILASFIVDNFENLSKSDDHMVAYFYCNYKEPERRSTDSILRSLVKQFCVKGVGEEDVSTLIEGIYREREAKGSARGALSSDESTDLVIRLSEKYQSTIIIVDALDECDVQTRRKLFFSLHSIAKKAARVKIVVTSRYDHDINQFFSLGPYHYIDAKDNLADIKLYIDIQLNQRCDRSNFPCEYELLLDGNVTPELKAEVKSTLEDKANGMFMWVNLQIMALCAARTVEGVKLALARMPRTLNETYLQVMKRIGAQDDESYRVAKRILKWLLYAQGVCTTNTIIQALAVDPGKDSLKNGLAWTIPMILGICKNLVIHDETLGTFRFAHFSVQEFLLSQPEFKESIGHRFIAEVCLTVLLYHYHPDKLTTTRDIYSYAAEHWAAHVHLSEVTSGLLEGLCTRFLESTEPYRAWGSEATKIHITLRAALQIGEVVPPLWVACYYELSHVSRLVLSASNEQLNSRNSLGQTPLSWAAGNGHEKVVQLLLKKKGVDVDSKDKEGRTPLSRAAGNGHEKVLQLLLAKEGVAVDSIDESRQTPLSWAAMQGRGKVVQLLLAKEGVSVDSKNNVGRTPLSWAAGNGYEEVVLLLLAKEGVDVNSKDMCDRTPLFWAAVYGYGKVVQLLLAKEGVSVDSKDSVGRTPLSRAAGNGYEEVVLLLLAKEGVDVDSKDVWGRTPLSWAAEHGYEKVVQLLLAKEGVSVDSKDSRGRTPLSWAAEHGYEKVVQLLLAKEGVSVDSKDSVGRTPLSWAAEHGYEKVVQLLLAKEGVSVDSKDGRGRTPLSWAAEHGYEKVVQLLLAKEGVSVDSKDSVGRTPLSWATKHTHRHRAVVNLLQAKLLSAPGPGALRQA